MRLVGFTKRSIIFVGHIRDICHENIEEEKYRKKETRRTHHD